MRKENAVLHMCKFVNSIFFCHFFPASLLHPRIIASAFALYWSVRKMLRPRAVQQIFWRPFQHDFKRYNFPTTFESESLSSSSFPSQFLRLDVVFPPDGEMKLPQLPMEPFYDAELGEQKYKSTKRMIEARGVEEIHTSLIHKQYGLAAVSGGMLRPTDFKLLTVNNILCQFIILLIHRIESTKIWSRISLLSGVFLHHGCHAQRKLKESSLVEVKAHFIIMSLPSGPNESSSRLEATSPNKR